MFWLESLHGELDVARTLFLEFMHQFVTLCVLSIGTPNANMVQILLVTMITVMTAQGGLTNLLIQIVFLVVQMSTLHQMMFVVIEKRSGVLPSMDTG